MTTSQDKTWKAKEQGDEAVYIRQKEQQKALQAKQNATPNTTEGAAASANQVAKDFEGGFGGQEDLEDRYATTSGEH